MHVYTLYTSPGIQSHSSSAAPHCMRPSVSVACHHDVRPSWPRTLSEALSRRAQIQLLCPGTLVLPVQLPVCLCDGVRANERLVWEHAPITWRVDRPIYYDVRHMDALQSKRHLTSLAECYASAADRQWKSPLKADMPSLAACCVCAAPHWPHQMLMCVTWMPCALHADCTLTVDT